MSALEPFFEERGVSTGVWKARPYVRYDKGDPERIVREAWAGHKGRCDFVAHKCVLANPCHASFAAMIANQTSGRIIPRFAPAGMRLARVPAELRPDNEVRTGSHWHFHGDERPDELLIPTTGSHLPKKWVHSPETMRTHVEDVHGGENVQTVHLDVHRGKYVFPPGRGDARRLDVHPQSWTQFVNAPRVFFGIEGRIKADAILSAGEAVFSVPSVTLWRAPELRQFALRYLAGRECVIVPDADWHANSQVEQQAYFCRSYLRRLGVNAKVAAPPIGGVKHGIKGVDDFLGSGGTMSEMIVLEQERPFGLAEWLGQHGWRVDRLVRNAEILEGMALHAGRWGTLTVSFRTMARIMGLPREQVRKALHDLEECDAITIEGSLDAGPVYRDKGFDWTAPPTITIHPELRSKPVQYPLG